MKPLPGYPKTMVHPAHQKGAAVPVHGTDPVSGRPFTDYHGTPDRYPPVEVNDPDQEERHRAMGYRVFGEQAVAPVAYQEYPKMLAHPKYEPAVAAIVEVRNGANQLISAGIPGREAKWPPVVVHTKDQEEAEKKRGYDEPGKPDPDAVQASIAAPYDPKRVTQEWPKIVNGVLTQNPAANQSGFQEYPKWIGDKLVNSRAEEEALSGPVVEDKAVAAKARKEAALKAKADAEAALAAADAELEEAGKTGPPPPPPTQEPVDRAALYAEAEQRGIEFNKRWSTAKILQALGRAAA